MATSPEGSPEGGRSPDVGRDDLPGGVAQTAHDPQNARRILANFAVASAGQPGAGGGLSEVGPGCRLAGRPEPGP